MARLEWNTSRKSSEAGVLPALPPAGGSAVRAPQRPSAADGVSNLAATSGELVRPSWLSQLSASAASLCLAVQSGGTRYSSLEPNFPSIQTYCHVEASSRRCQGSSSLPFARIVSRGQTPSLRSIVPLSPSRVFLLASVVIWLPSPPTTRHSDRIHSPLHLFSLPLSRILPLPFQTHCRPFVE